ncbi:MAG: LemA family protein [Gemmatimonadaceae bacterium]|nr:LemA family protein [Gemmatimonadaceae bacterium]NUS97594.1 LemA family protein [Gemmatimonadaceae bacterium]
MKRRVGVILAAMLATGCGYNNIQTYDEQAAAAQGQIETQLQRRADLIPNLVSTVKGYAQHEEQIFTAVADARSRLLGAKQSGDPTAMANADAQMTGALGRLLAISENYPQLKADANFRQLQDELTGTENRIAVARTDYNDAARQYNTYIRQFPTALTAKVTGAKPRKYFEVTDPAMRSGPPSVDFSKPATPAP